MARLIVSIVLVAMLAMLALLAVPWGAAWAQERATCSQARAHCGTQRVCQRRFDTCMQTGCWTVVLVKRCGYEKR
jgi:predicted transglutaminase-like cysteine proteinase